MSATIGYGGSSFIVQSPSITQEEHSDAGDESFFAAESCISIQQHILIQFLGVRMPCVARRLALAQTSLCIPPGFRLYLFVRVFIRVFYQYCSEALYNMDDQKFIEGALQFARQSGIEFDSYDLQYQSLHCLFLPLYYRQATIGIVSVDQEGNFRFTRLAANTEERGSPRNC